MSQTVIEVCVESVDGVLAAEAAGADRAELCADLVEGGVTPSAGMIAEARRRASLGLMVMIRPRGGDFLYSDVELEIMKRDIATARELGADGVVFGLLRPDGSVDEERTRPLVELARPMKVTFHRAFDMSRDPHEALEVLIRLGVDRVLTSGQQESAADATELLRELIERAGDRIHVLPGGGITEENVDRLLRETGAREVHFAALVTRDSEMEFRNPRLGMGAGGVPGEYERKITERDRVASMVRRVRDRAR